jgi:hypothetical protein
MLVDRFAVGDGDFVLKDRLRDLSTVGVVFEHKLGDADLDLLDRFREEGLELEVGGRLGEDRVRSGTDKSGGEEF